MMNYILQFNFETGDKSCKYYQIYIVVNSPDHLDFEALEDSIVSYFESNASSEDLEYEDNVEDIMRESGLIWRFMHEGVPESKLIHSFWI